MATVTKSICGSGSGKGECFQTTIRDGEDEFRSHVHKWESGSRHLIGIRIISAKIGTIHQEGTVEDCE